MRHLFFLALAGVLILVVAGWALFMFGRALVEVFNDWRLNKELDQLAAESDSRRKQRQEARSQRLANGCEHDFGGGSVGLPLHVCSKCGREQEKPPGHCDHVWRLKPGAVPGSECEHCGKQYSPIETPTDFK